MQSLLKIAQHTRYHEISTTSTSKFKTARQICLGMMDALSAKGARAQSKDKVFCNLCDWHGSHFVDFHVGYNLVFKKSVCPNCFSHPRHRAYKYVIEKIMAGFEDQKVKVLHFAPEPIIAFLLNQYPNVEYLSVDIDHNRAMRREDITNLTLKDNQYDFIICIHVLEHIENDQAAMRELLRVLKPETGIALLDVPVDYSRAETYEDKNIVSPAERTKAFWQWDHVRLYGRDFAQKLRAVGFNVQEDAFIQQMDKTKIEHEGLEATPNYICSKKS